MAKRELKDARVVRIFISSPFKGLEEERTLLTKFYWPKIEAELTQKGLNLRLVDMRWGITSSSMSAADTVNICLREISRSDIFVGMYAQRYGWNGLDDKAYQENLDRAAKKFPWVNDYRDRSVTELEYLHGHLNNPGAIPACFCFRDKKYCREQFDLAKGDLRTQKSFATEDDVAGKKLQDLKSRVHKTAKDTIGVNIDYSNPEEAAEYIYNRVLGYIRREILSKMEAPLNDYERIALAHKAYQSLGLGLNVFGEKYIKAIENYIQQDRPVCNPLILIGPTGCGLTEIICNWLEKHVNAKSQGDKKYFYHFVGAEPNSASPRHLLERIIGFVELNLNGKQYASDKKIDLGKLVMKTRETLMKMQSAEHKDQHLVILVNKVDNIQVEKSTMPLFWLPKDLPPNVKIILSLTDGAPGSDEKMQILTHQHKTERLDIKTLTEEEKKVLCTKLLEENSKLMEEDQLNMIIASPKTNNLMFLTILISELCVSGKFNTLTQQIKDLLQCDGVSGLMLKVIERIEKDHDTEEYKGNDVEDVLCALCLCKQGISEDEFPMPPDIWGPIIITLDQFIIDRGGLLSFAFPEILNAVEARFLDDEEKKKSMAMKVAAIFLDRYMKNLRNKTDVNVRTATELLHLLRLSGDREQLLKIISDIRIFEAVTKIHLFELNEYWQWLDTPTETIAQIYIDSINKYISEVYSVNWHKMGADYQAEALERKSILLSSIREWFEGSKMFHGLSYLLDQEMDVDSNRPGLTDLQRKKILCGLKYQKACFLSDSQDYEEALKLHTEVLETRQELMKHKMITVEELGLSCNGVGLCYYNIKALAEAEKTFMMGLAIENSAECKSQQASTYSNLGLINLERKEYQEALERFEKSLALRQQAQSDILSLDDAYAYHNLGLTHRNMRNYDMAAEYYTKSLKVKEMLLGRHSFDAALSIMNLGTLEGYRKNDEKSLDYAREALEIFKNVAPEGSNYVALAKENVVNQLTVLDRFAEAEPLFQEIRSSRGLPAIHRKFVRWYMRENRVEEAAKLAFELVSWSDFPGDFVTLNWADRKLPPAKRPKRPQWATIDYAYKKWPTFRPLLSFKLASVIENTPDQFKSFVEQHCQKPSVEATVQCYAELAVVLKDDMKDMGKAIEVVKIGVEKTNGDSKLKNVLKCLQSS